ncbi:hypothetical protein [Hyphomicrobium sp. 99]|uniref:phage integrase central domain-containing protein n=1 Tax=Hyphomicrobium sp. 99 TaxID=1163419 RepID=UPI0012DFF333|nr:hypothetical protein [Hyphomicrobium sp. 99]
MTFKECAEAYMAAHEPSWKNAKHCEQWHSTLRRYLYPKFGGVAVSSVTTEMVLDAIQPIWHSMPETASRVRGRIEVVIDWAKAMAERPRKRTLTDRWDVWFTRGSGASAAHHLADKAISTAPGHKQSLLMFPRYTCSAALTRLG